jgi:hypothetical protein
MKMPEQEILNELIAYCINEHVNFSTKLINEYDHIRPSVLYDVVISSLCSRLVGLIIDNKENLPCSPVEYFDNITKQMRNGIRNFLEYH